MRLEYQPEPGYPKHHRKFADRGDCAGCLRVLIPLYPGKGG
jgi:hypothetical protein